MKRSSVHDSTARMSSHSRWTNAWLIAGVLLVAVNLRSALSSVGPLVEEIRLATGLSNSLLGLLTTLPLIAFGIISALTPLFTRRFGIGGTLLGAMALLILGIAIRSMESVGALYVGTFLLGVAIAFGNVLLPSIAKRNFDSHSGWITSLYSSAMGVGAALAAGLSYPLTSDFKLGWRGALAVWAIPAILALIVWTPQLRSLKRSEHSRSFKQSLKDLGASSLAWQVALFMGLQSLTFYVVLAWLPAILISRGYTSSYSGWMLSLSQATGILGSLIVPVVAGRRVDQRGIVVVLLVAEVAGLIGLLMPQLGWVAVWVSILGFVLGGTFGLALLLIVVRSSTTEIATELSGMAQSIGYLVAATGPFLFGSLFDATGNWSYSLLSLLGIAGLKLCMGLGAARPAVLTQPESADQPDA